MLTGFAMRRWKYNRLIPGQTVDAHIEEAAHGQTKKDEDDYQKNFHGCLLWTYHGPEVNMSLVLLPGVASCVNARAQYCFMHPFWASFAWLLGNAVAPIIIPCTKDKTTYDIILI